MFNSSSQAGRNQGKMFFCHRYDPDVAPHTTLYEIPNSFACKGLIPSMPITPLTGSEHPQSTHTYTQFPAAGVPGSLDRVYRSLHNELSKMSGSRRLIGSVHTHISDICLSTSLPIYILTLSLTHSWAFSVGDNMQFNVG